MNVIKKSRGTSFILTLLFGPLGLLYASVVGGIILIVLAIISAPTFIGPIICWVVAIAVGDSSVSKHNKNVDLVLATIGQNQGAGHVPVHKEKQGFGIFETIGIVIVAFVVLIVMNVVFNKPSTLEQGSSPQREAKAEPKIPVIVDIKKVAGKSESEVSSVLGEPTSTEQSKHGQKCFYTGGHEVVFSKGKATLITIEGLGKLAFAPSALEALGVKQQEPSFKSGLLMRWNNIGGMQEVSIFEASGRCSYAYIKMEGGE